MDVLEALEAESGVVAVVGAGGKKTTLYTLAARAGDRGTRAVVTATVRIPIFDPHVESVTVTGDPVAALEETNSWPAGVVPEREGEDRYVGYEPAVIRDLEAAGVADLVLVKADGARTREFKAPDEHEPQLPDCVDTVVPIASVAAVGSPLSSDLVHRPERVAAITGLEIGETIRPEDVARVLASERGGLADVPDGATVIPLLNKVDDEKRLAVAREIGTDLLERTPAVSRVVLGRMIDDETVVDVLEE
ncbi:selenium cofactor biosynthesis protein YqeC [Natrarchaeobius chitinivorans]|uniref:Putative selenium-dependent hydroxylase accessory protein YqeC n=1 Tax=Natrarchaeobius chitinivorans TaxID=1679083 RepID=A0A3N6M939_NATCH|nr:selenium cofactor biosynthesis protein YqeC [Natrarchaeobius chitinivorans]RQG97204.1 putative selenium-dependent hydroxylase accessory protein YqeC [Natrarchaeobius chitinivorans]